MNLTQGIRRRLSFDLLESRHALSGLTGYVTAEHMHLNGGYSAGSDEWRLDAHDSDNDINYDLDTLGMYVGTQNPQAQPAGSEFLGAGTGGTYYQLPANPDGEMLTVSFTGYNFSPAGIDSYDAATDSKGRVVGAARWIKYSLLGVAHSNPDGTPGTGKVSIFTGGSFGTPAKVFAASFNDGVANPDGAGLDVTDGISADDAVWVPVGGHLHYSWAFTKPGRYEVTFGISARMAGTVEESQPFTAHFIVGSTGQLEFSAPEYRVTGGVPTATLTVQRVGGHDGPLTVAYSATDGTAFDGVDYENATGVIAFADGQESAIIAIPLLGTIPTEPRTFTITLSDPGPNNLAFYVADFEGRSLLGGQTNADVVIDAAAPRLLSTIVNGNDSRLSNLPAEFANQRSMVRGVQLTFDRPVTLTADAIALVLHAGVGALPGSRMILNSTGTTTADAVWNVTFLGANVIGGSIADGEYDLTIDPAKVTDGFGVHLTAAPPAFTFYRLLGDADGNRTVNNLDIVYVRRRLGTTQAAGDYLWLFDSDWNGTVNNLDVVNVKRNAGKTI
jgi:surface-anchored protein